MSALGHEQTSHQVRVMTVIPLKADIRRRNVKTNVLEDENAKG
jgi:hypothetical protein